MPKVEMVYAPDHQYYSCRVRIQKWELWILSSVLYESNPIYEH